MSKRSAPGLSLQEYVDRADQLIIKGEERISRLKALAKTMAAAGYEIGPITTLMTKQVELLQSWSTRRSVMVSRLSQSAHGFSTNKKCGA